MRLKRHISYANVMSTLAVFMVVAGGSFAIASVSKNQVKSKHVKDNALKSKDLKDGKGVEGKDVKDDSLRGTDVDESSLGKVPSATSADTATNANNADTLDGVDSQALVTSKQGSDSNCSVGTAFTDCVGTTVTLGRTQTVVVYVTAVYGFGDAEGNNVEADCRIERDGASISSNIEIGSGLDDTNTTDRQRVLAIVERETNVGPGAVNFYLACREDTAGDDFQLEDIRTVVLAAGNVTP